MSERPEGIFAAEGGVISYGFDQIDSWRGAAVHVDRILRGEKPGELPIQAPTKFEPWSTSRPRRRWG
jgi:putative ABC transport system substrate-binding protein